ncbi:MAG: protein kinase, partial [Myxococcales bacterium]|nr:protein kinase [Myxococcales bacterium]
PTLAQVLEVFTAAGSGLAAAHDKGLVHRDFKPDNVMVGLDGRVRVMDFGLARVEQPSGDELIEQGLESSSTVLDLTGGGALVGTPAYMAPEQLYGRRATPASDQFSFCVSLFEQLVGRRPFTASSLQELCARIEARDVDPGIGNSQVPSWLRELIVRGLEPVPSDRHASMRALLAALEQGARKAGLSEHRAPSYVFVAYGGQDQALALRVCESLLDHGVRPWLDLWEDPHAADAGPRLEQALRDAPALLLLTSRGGLQRLQREHGEVLKQRIDANPSTVHHVRLPPGAGEVASVSGHLGIALDEARWFEGIAELARSLGTDRQRQTWLADEATRVGLSPEELEPYVGARPYDAADARWMFGRSAELSTLLTLLRSHRVVLLVGAPGSGKSSLL